MRFPRHGEKEGRKKRDVQRREYKGGGQDRPKKNIPRGGAKTDALEWGANRQNPES